MKNKILTASASLVSLATLVGVIGALVIETPQLAARVGTAGGIMALGSIGLFMVGLATPKDNGQSKQ